MNILLIYFLIGTLFSLWFDRFAEKYKSEHVRENRRQYFTMGVFFWPLSVVVMLIGFVVGVAKAVKMRRMKKDAPQKDDE